MSWSMTGLISVSSSMRSLITMVRPCIGLNATQPPRANAGLMVTPSSVTVRSVRGKPYRRTSLDTAGFLPSASSTFCQSISCACAEVTNGSEKICQSIFCAFAPEANEAMKIETIIPSILRIVWSSRLGVRPPVLVLVSVSVSVRLMFFDDRIESLLILVRAHPYVSAGHPDFITVGRLQVWIRHAEFIVLDFPGPGPFPAHFTAEKHPIGPEITHPMGAIGNVVSDDPGADFLFAEQFEHVLCVCDRSTNRRRQQHCQRKDLRRSTAHDRTPS